MSSGETKWKRQNGLVVLLPHGFEGQGPEHSSARMERFLQMGNEDPDRIPPLAEVLADVEEGKKSAREEECSSWDYMQGQLRRCNWQIVVPTTPASYFHVLRRQLRRTFRKPLIVINPKQLLKLKASTSSMDELAEGTNFQTVIPDVRSTASAGEEDSSKEGKKTRRVILCSGKIYYDLDAERQDKKNEDVAIIRLEQLAPFPFHRVAEELAKYPNAEVVWTQEEPKNMGAWYYVQDRIMTASRVLNGSEVRPAYVGRPTESSPASGYGAVHTLEQTHIVNLALSTQVTDYGHGIDSDRHSHLTREKSII